MIIKRLGKIFGGCLLILIILVILGIIFSGVIIKKLISGTIQQKTGVSVNVDNIDKGKLTYTDPKTGATLNIGTNKIPDSFPKDFPVYPGSVVTTSQTGSGFWLTLNTKDSSEKVASYYQTNLEANGWNPHTISASGWSVEKNKLVGTIIVEKGQNDTSILIVLGESNK